MIIDCHAHIGRNDNISASVPELLKSMDMARIDKAFVYANKIGDASNEYMLKQIAPHRDRLYGVAACSISEGAFINGKMFADLYESGEIVAVKFYTGYDHWYPANTDRVLSALNEVCCPVIYHMGDCHRSQHNKAKLKYAQPLGVDEVAVDFPNIKFVIAHMGYPWHQDAAQVCYKNENVYTDISGFVYGKFSGLDKVRFKKVLQEFLIISSSDKLLLGTDWPISDQSSYLDTLDEMFGEVLTPQYLTNNVQKVFNI